jgi:hypothetical protein
VIATVTFVCYVKAVWIIVAAIVALMLAGWVFTQTIGRLIGAHEDDFFLDATYGAGCLLVLSGIVVIVATVASWLCR